MRCTLWLVAATSLAWCAGERPDIGKPDAGKQVFMERCGSCHDERGGKPLSTGLPLNQRTLTDAQLNRAVAGRLKSSPEEVKSAVAQYIRSLLTAQK